MEKSKPVVVGIGELLWDVFPEVKKAGGAPINFVYHATQLGAEGYAISAVGNDVFGTEIIQELDKNGIDSNYISTVEYPTGSVMVELKNGIPSYTIIEGVAWDHIPLTQASIDPVSYTHLTTMCKENNLPIIVFDMDTNGNLKKVMSGENIGTLVHN